MAKVMAEIEITTMIDTSGLRAALALAGEYTSRTPALAVNTAAFWITRGVARNTRKTEVGRISTELNVNIIPRISTSGKVLGYSRKTRVLSGGPGTARTSKSVPLAVLIVMAASKPGSNYNARTGYRFYRSRSSLIGGFRSKMRDAISHMLKARRASVAFLAASTIPAIKAFEQTVSPKYRRGAPGLAVAASASFKAHSNTGKSSGTPAKEDGLTAVAAASYDVGLVGLNAASQNAAMHRIIGPVVQQQVDIEAVRSMEYVAVKQAEEMAAKGRSIGVMV